MTDPGTPQCVDDVAPSDRTDSLVVIGAAAGFKPRRCVDAPSESRVAAGCSAIEFDHCVFDLVVRERDGLEIRCGHDGNTERLDDDALAGLRPDNSVGDVLEDGGAIAR